MKRKKPWIVAVCVLLTLGAGIVAALWVLTQYPYEDQYFSVAMKTKYTTPEKVWQAVQSGDAKLVSEAYGFDVARMYGPNIPINPLPPMEKIQYSRNGKLALLDRQNHCCLWKEGRWVFYPENYHLMVYQLIWGSLY